MRRYKDLTFCAIEVSLMKRRELYRALGLRGVPNLTTLYRFLRRLEKPTPDRATGETVRRL